MAQASSLGYVLVTAWNGIHFWIVPLQGLKQELFVTWRITEIPFSRMLSSLVNTAGDGDAGDNNMTACVHLADKMSAEPHVSSFCIHMISSGGDREAMLPALAFHPFWNVLDTGHDNQYNRSLFIPLLHFESRITTRGPITTYGWKNIDMSKFAISAHLRAVWSLKCEHAILLSSIIARPPDDSIIVVFMEQQRKFVRFPL